MLTRRAASTAVGHNQDVCGRYHQHKPLDALALMFEVGQALEDPASFVPRWNIAPTQPAPVVRARSSGERTLSMMRWGLVPPWAPDLSGGARCINARAETAPDKPTFREPVRQRRCIVPATGWYEWQVQPDGSPKRAFTFEPTTALTNDGVLAFAGLWSQWRPRDGGEAVETVSVLTVDANTVASVAHARMPLLLAADAWARWLDPNEHSVQTLAPLVRPAPDAWIRARRIGARVNAARNDDPGLLDDVP